MGSFFFVCFFYCPTMPRAKTRSKGVYKGKKGKQVKQKSKLDDDPMYDAVDHFMKGSDEVRFDDDSSEDSVDLEENGDHVMQLSKEKSLYDSSEDDLDSSSDEEEINRSKLKEKRLNEKYEEWGRLGGRDKYHGADVKTNRETYESAIQEEEEAKYLQEQQVANLEEGDFAIDDEDDGSDSEDEYWDEAEQKERFQQAAKSIEGVSLLPSGSTKKQETKNNKKPSKKLSKEEKLEILERDSPELLGLLNDFQGKLGELKNNVQPLLSEVSKKGLPTSDGISFLEAKYHLLLNYCMNMGFYMLMKAEGKQVEDHPVISQLVRLRLILDKIKPIDQKLHYQVQKYLKMSLNNADTGDMEEGLQHKPNIDSFGQIDDDDDEEEDKTSSGVYKLKKVAPTSYEGDLPKGKKRQRKLKSDTAMAKYIREEFSKEQKYEVEFEEDNFMRLAKKGKERRRQEKEVLKRSELEDPLDFRDITGFGSIGDQNEEEDSRPTKSRLEALINSVERKPSLGNSEIDLPYDSWSKRKPLSKRSLEEFQEQGDISDHFGGGNMETDDFVDEDISEEEYYEEVKQAKKKRKLNNYYETQQPKEFFDDTIEEDEKRGVNFQISKNKGLTRSRPKKVRNSRVNYRRKAERASKILPKKKDQLKPYQGEATGVRKNIQRSVNLQ